MKNIYAWMSYQELRNGPLAAYANVVWTKKELLDTRSGVFPIGPLNNGNLGVTVAGKVCVDLPRDGQPKPRSVRLGREEGLENITQVRFRDSLPVVRYGNAHVGLVSLDSLDWHASSVGIATFQRVNTVHNEIQNHLLHMHRSAFTGSGPVVCTVYFNVT